MTKHAINSFLAISVTFANEIAAFIDSVTKGSTPPTTTHDGLMALVLAEAALKSVAEGRSVKVAELL